MLQLSLFDEAPAPVVPPAAGLHAPFYIGGWKVWYVDLPFGKPHPYGWRLAHIGEEQNIAGAYALTPLRTTIATWARVAGLPNDLYAKGWERDERPGLTHWLHWPGNGVSCCLDTLERNIAAARQMRSQGALRATAQARCEAEAAAVAAKKTKKRKKAA